MSFLITLDNIGLAAPNEGGDFRVQYQPNLQLPTINNLPVQYELALVNANLWYSWANVKPVSPTQAATDVFDYYNGAVWRGPYTIPTGQYSINDINTYLHGLMDTNGDFTLSGSGEHLYDINISPNYNTLRVDIAISGGYRLDLSLSELNTLLGWTSQIVTVSGTGAKVANINNSINSLLIHCDIVTSSYYNNDTSTIIWSFVPNVRAGANIEIHPGPKLIFLPLNVNNRITNIRMFITDNLGRPIDFRGEAVTYQLQLRPIRNLFTEPKKY